MFSQMGLGLSIILLLANCPSNSYAWEHLIYVDQLNGNDTPDCLQLGAVRPCETLAYAFQDYRDSTQYVLLPGVHLAEDDIPPFTHLHDISIVGDESMVHCTGPNTGFTFIAVQNIYIANVSFFNCSRLQNSTSRDFGNPYFSLLQFPVELYFFLCENVSLSSVNVSNNPRALGVAMYDTIGNNMIVDSTFSHNVISAVEYPGGGGFYVEFSYCIPGDNDCTNDVESHISANSNSHYTFHNCTFSNNKASNGATKVNSTFIVAHHRDHESFGRGGGLALFFGGNASHNTFLVSDCTFDSNSGIWGGAIIMEFEDHVAGNEVRVKDSVFHHNYCPYSNTSGTAAGAMDIAHYVFGGNENNISGNNIILENCTFFNNSALNGGAISVSAALQDAPNSQIGSVVMKGCRFEQNIARLGAAVQLSQYLLAHEGKLLDVRFTDCNFTNNSVVYYNYTLYEAGVGAVYTNRIPIHLLGENYFGSNNGSALAIIGAVANFSGGSSVTFQSNVGHDGAGIYLLGTSSIIVDDSTVMKFESNYATLHGGAIHNVYIERESLGSYRNCFILHTNPYALPDNWNSTFNFHNNSAGISGNAIYSTSLLPCAQAGGPGIGGIDDIFCWNEEHWDYGGKNCSSEIASSAGRISFHNGSSTVEAFPGRVFYLPLNIYDDLGHEISKQTVFIANSYDPNTALVDPNFSYVSAGAVNVTGKDNSTFILELQQHSNPGWHVDIHVKLKACPPGFKPSSNTANATCICGDDFVGAVRCDETKFLSRIRNAFWLGPAPDDRYNGTLVATLCAPGYCSISSTRAFLPLPKLYEELDGFICGRQQRTGTLCGRCIPGYAPAVNSDTYECVRCPSSEIPGNVAKYIFTDYVPVIVFFIIIIAFNLKLTTGAAIGFIFYSQVVSSTFSLFADEQIPLTTNQHNVLMASKLLYGIFNLEFFENFLDPYCLGPHFNALDIIELSYGVAILPLLMIIAVLVFMRLKNWLFATRCVRSCRIAVLNHRIFQKNWKLGHSLVHAFAAFVLLSYIRFSLTSSYLVTLQPLVNAQGDQLGVLRSWFAGQYASDDTEYVLKYALPAYIVFATFVAIPPILLLDYPVRLFEWCLRKFPRLWRYYRVDYVNILLDTFQGSFKGNRRFFAGLYFLFRLAINVTYIVTDGWLKNYTVNQIIIVLFIVIVAYFKPYRQELFNYVDIALFTNLSLLNTLNLFLYEYSQNFPGEPLPKAAFLAQDILVFLPWVYMIVYLIWYFSKPYHTKIKQRVLESRYVCYIHRNHRYTSGKTNRSLTSFEDSYEIEAILERAEGENTYRPLPELVKVVNEEPATAAASYGATTGSDTSCA